MNIWAITLKRIRCLYAHDNRIHTLEGSLKQLRFLTELTLYNNQLRDLQVCY